jgi:hypothetical protein
MLTHPCVESLFHIHAAKSWFLHIQGIDATIIERIEEIILLHTTVFAAMGGLLQRLDIAVH